MSRSIVGVTVSVGVCGAAAAACYLLWPRKRTSCSAKGEETSSRDFPVDVPPAAKLVQLVAKPLAFLVTSVTPLVIRTTAFVHRYWSKLPQNALRFIYGSVFCFFGGTFPTLFAAIQAAEHSGRQQVMKALQALSDEAMAIIEESKKDDALDEDKDGTADVDQISKAEYVARKLKLVLRKMNPGKIDEAVGSLYRVWLAVAAVLSIEFARTISMSLAIADFLNKPAQRYVAPTVQMAVPDDYDKWVPVVLRWITKGVAMSIAWYVRSVLTAFSSALAGGKMMAMAMYYACVHRKINPLGLIPEDPAKTYVDEALSYTFAGLGFYFQFKCNFSPPFPLNLVLAPASIAEHYIRWSITDQPAAA